MLIIVMILAQDNVNTFPNNNHHVGPLFSPGKNLRKETETVLFFF